MEGGATVNEIVAKYDLNPNLARNWKAKAESDPARVFSVADGMAASGVAACMRDAFDEHGEPAIVDSDQGSAFNSAQYEGLLKGRRVMQRMDGKDRWVDNVIIERWFRSLKSEWLRANERSTQLELRRLVAQYVDQHNSTRPRESLGYETPESWCHSGLTAA